MQFEIYRLIDMQRLEIPLTREVKVFHVILELAVHGDFECIDNQLVGKTNAHFGSLKLSKCALSFFSVLIFSSLQKCLHRAFRYVHLSAEEARKVNRIPANFSGTPSRHFRCFVPESEPNSSETLALSPSYIPIQRTYIVPNAISHPTFGGK